MRKALALTTTAVALLGTGLLAAPASAACGATGDTCSGTTAVAFSVATGTIAIVPTAASAGAAGAAGVVPSTVLTGSTAGVDVPLGSTQVVDLRLASTGWVMSAAVGDFALTGGGGTILKANAAFSVPALPTAVPATTLLPSPPVLSTFSSRTSTATPMDATSGKTQLLVCNSAGPNGAAFIPYLHVTPPTGTVSGVYTGTVTQSVV